jgi:16S rRNA (adenine1518-N6/adenine1519-N6)-dimethyltransferase
MENILEETKSIMKKYKIRANKNLGQNFLINNEVVEKIIESSELSQEDLVIEIGPGLGTLTKYLLEKARKVICIELDSKMVKILQDRFAEKENFEIINEDILKVELDKIIKENKKTGTIKNVKVVANLPYYITTPIIMKLLEEKLDIKRSSGKTNRNTWWKKHRSDNTYSILLLSI